MPHGRKHIKRSMVFPLELGISFLIVAAWLAQGTPVSEFPEGLHAEIVFVQTVWKRD